MVPPPAPLADAGAPGGGSPEVGALRVLVLARRDRDVDVAGETLGRPVEPFDPSNAGRSERGSVGAVLVTQDALGRGGPSAGGVALAQMLADQPGWSDLPVLLFVDRKLQPGEMLRAAAQLGPRANVTVLERPLRRAALKTVVEAALRARRKQLEVRDLLDQVTALNEGLQDRVEAQTRALRRRAEQVEALARDLGRAERRERERIAQLLHDDLQQLLYGVKIQVDRLASGAIEATPPRLGKVAGHLDDAIETTRLLTTDLHPPTFQDDGLGSALGWVADFARRRHGMAVHLDVIDEIEVPDPDVMSLLSRAAKELLFNVVKHAGVREAWVSAWCDAEGCHVSVRDEGGGFPADGADGRGGTGLGLANLRDRVRLLGGHVQVESEKGRGSRVAVVVPKEV